MRAHGVVAASAHVGQYLPDRALDVARRRQGLAQRGDHGRRIVAAGSAASRRRLPSAMQLAQAGRRARPARRCAARGRRGRRRGARCSRPRCPRRSRPATAPAGAGAGERRLDQRHHAVGQPVGDGAVEGADDLDHRDLDAARREVRARERAGDGWRCAGGRAARRARPRRAPRRRPAARRRTAGRAARRARWRARAARPWPRARRRRRRSRDTRARRRRRAA